MSRIVLSNIEDASDRAAVLRLLEGMHRIAGIPIQLRAKLAAILLMNSHEVREEVKASLEPEDAVLAARY